MKYNEDDMRQDGIDLMKDFITIIIIIMTMKAFPSFPTTSPSSWVINIT